MDSKPKHSNPAAYPANIAPSAVDGACLDPMQLSQLEDSFRQWTGESPRRNARHSRQRILLIFLLIRYTGAKLNEILALDPFTDIQGQSVCIRDLDSNQQDCARTITIAENLAREIRETLLEPGFRDRLDKLFAVDPAFVRRKFYERAAACGFDKHLCGPEMIRRARAVELVQGNMPLPAVQRMMGHASPNLTAAHVSYSPEELERITRLFMERESHRTSSARNTFYGKISAIDRGDVQARVTLVNPVGHCITTMITMESLVRLQLHVGRLVTAEVKAPWVLVHPGNAAIKSSAENQFSGKVARINRGKVSTEYVIRLADGMELCAMLSSESSRALGLGEGDAALVLFNCFAVILHD